MHGHEMMSLPVKLLLCKEFSNTPLSDLNYYTSPCCMALSVASLLLATCNFL